MSATLVKFLVLPPPGTYYDGQPQAQQTVADNQARDLPHDDIRFSNHQYENCQQQFGHVAGGHVEQAANGGAKSAG